LAKTKIDGRRKTMKIHQNTFKHYKGTEAGRKVVKKELKVKTDASNADEARTHMTTTNSLYMKATEKENAFDMHGYRDHELAPRTREGVAWKYMKYL
jgi:hypothetical protein